jgi:Ion channel
MIPFPAAFALGAALFLVVLWEAFETIILPRRVTRRFRLTRVFYRITWGAWSFLACLISSKKRREALLGFYGPISLLLLLVVWAVGLILSFGLLHYGAGSAVSVTGMQPGFATDIYLSGTNFFTLGLGDVVPRSPIARALTVTEGGVGFGFLAIVIGYLPVFYQAFSRREVNISLLDARAGTPPTAGELLRRHGFAHGQEALQSLLKDWERWSAELMESHLSYPALAFFRSQHDNQSWLSSLTAILDTCALVMTGLEGACERQAELTFAIARHAVVDLSQIFGTGPLALPQERLSPAELSRLREVLAQHGFKMRDGEEADRRLTALRRMYEPYVHTLASYLNLALPPWIPAKKTKDNWQTTAWAQAAGSPAQEIEIAAAVADDQH